MKRVFSPHLMNKHPLWRCLGVIMSPISCTVYTMNEHNLLLPFDSTPELHFTVSGVLNNLQVHQILLNFSFHKETSLRFLWHCLGLHCLERRQGLARDSAGWVCLIIDRKNNQSQYWCEVDGTKTKALSFWKFHASSWFLFIYCPNKDLWWIKLQPVNSKIHTELVFALKMKVKYQHLGLNW